MRLTRRPGRRAILILLGAAVVAGCGGPAPVDVAADEGTVPPAATSTEPAPTTAPAASATAAPPSVLTPDPTPGSAAPEPAAEPVRLPWPAHDKAGAAELQRSVDGGSEPWLLDPAEVAVSYASTAHGWTAAQAQPRPGGSTVDVAEGGKKLTLTLAQPGRTGAGGIWVVTAETSG